ncbi:MAG TPA: DUF4920 domain-containing protein [Myxococcales bacterium]|nr:DUF4920 domain-containing protein [Myxococcales bacterium]
MLLRSLTPAAVLASAAITLAALAHDSAPTPAPRPAQATTATAKAGVLARGEKLKGLPPVKLAELVGAPDKYQDKAVRLEGTVRRACDKMGCWMELAENATPAAPGVRVLMKDHGFFVPTDSAGSRATVEGKVTVQSLSDEDAHHYESEGGTVPRGQDGKAREVRVEATGVELVRS